MIILFLIAGVSIAALAWFGLVLLRQESAVQAQHAQETLEQSADRVSARLRAAVSQISTTHFASAGSESLTLTFRGANFVASTPLLCWPFPSADPEAPFSNFLEGENLEYRQGQPYLALAWYRKLAASPIAAIRAGALLREARVLRNLGKSEESQSVYRQLADIHGVQIAGAPADLVGSLASHQDPSTLQHALLEGRWHLTRGQLDFFWNQTAAPRQQPPAEKILWSDAAALLAHARPESNRILFVGDTPLYVIAAENRNIIVKPETLMRGAAANEPVLYAALDPAGRILAGSKEGNGRPVVRTGAENQLPWTISFTSAPSLSDANLANRKRFVLLGLAVTFFFSALRDDGVGYGDYLEQLTYLIFLKMADEYSKPPHKRGVGIPTKYTWPSLKSKRSGTGRPLHRTLARIREAQGRARADLHKIAE